MVNLPNGREIQGSLGVRSLLLRSILRLVRLNGLSELALPRLKQELINAELEKNRILREGMAGGKAADQVLGFGIFVFIGSIFIVGWWSILVLVLFGLIANLMKKPAEVIQAADDAADREVTRIKQQLEAHRKVLDQELT